MKHDEEPAAKERERHISIGQELLIKNASECLVIFIGADGNFYYTTTNRTWAMGALRRVQMSLDERERIDTRREEAE